MNKHILLSALVTGIVLCSTASADAHVKRHHHMRPWCTTHSCAPKQAWHPPRHHYPVLDGTEPLCGFNDGTYLRNALECGL